MKIALDPLDPGEPGVMVVEADPRAREARKQEEAGVDAVDGHTVRSIVEDRLGGVNDRSDMAFDADLLDGLAGGGIPHGLALPDPAAGEPHLSLRGFVHALDEEDAPFGDDRDVHARDGDVPEDLLVDFGRDPEHQTHFSRCGHAGGSVRRSSDRDATPTPTIVPEGRAAG